MENKKVLITGANRGIGKGIAESLLSCGFQVLATSRMIENFDFNHENLTKASLDIGDTKAVAEFQKVVEEFNPTILINNAGITKDNLTIRMSLEEWSKVINVNLTSTFLMCKYSIKKMLKNKSGKIVNITSVVGHTGNLGQANYTASKAGIIAMSKLSLIHI